MRFKWNNGQLVKWSLKYHDGTRNEPQMDDEVGSLASIVYYLQPIAHRSFSAYYLCEIYVNYLCKSLLMSLSVAGGCRRLCRP